LAIATVGPVLAADFVEQSKQYSMSIVMITSGQSHYNVSDVMSDLLDVAAHFSLWGGRLVYIFPQL
jgi:hypothetical protein